MLDEDLSHLSENDQIIARRQKVQAARPVYGSPEHYKRTEARNIAFNRDIQIAYALKRLYQIKVEDHLDLFEMIGSEAHFRGMVGELYAMNYLLKKDFDNGLVDMPQFSTDTFDNGKDIRCASGRKVEVKGETPVIIANAVSFPKGQKTKVLGVDDLFVLFYGSKDGEETWFCGYLFHFDMRAMPETEWVDYAVGVPGDPIHRFGHGMGASMDECTPWATPVAKIPDETYKALIGKSGSQYLKDDNFRPGKVTRKVSFPEFVDRQNRKHGR
jgi:hypothetical protein